MTEELNTHIEKRYSECRKRSQGLSYGSFYDGYVDCYYEQQKRVTELENENALIKNSDSLCKLIGEQKLQIKKLENKVDYAKSIIKSLLDNSDEYAEQRARDFLKE